MNQEQTYSNIGAHRMVVQVELLTPSDEHLLKKCSDEINKKHFAGKIQSTVRWGIPSAAEEIEPSIEKNDLSAQDLVQLSNAVKAFQSQDFAKAKDILEPFYKAGHKPAGHLLVRILMLEGDPAWKEVALENNKGITHSHKVPAASTEFVEDSKTVIIHKSLSKDLGRGCPRAVIKYLVFHEFLHIWLETTSEDPHPKAFRMIESTFKDRSKAIEWLRKNMFDTISEE